MALIHRATLRPTKLELLAAWLPHQTWFHQAARAAPSGATPTGEVLRVAAFRFDDPAGAVGIETMLVRVGEGPVHQVPLTYRDAPLAGRDAWLLGTAEHSALGTRWIYDGCGDPVYAAALASAILGNTGQAEEWTQVNGELEQRELGMRIAGSVTGEAGAPATGAIQQVVQTDPTLIVTDTVELGVIRQLDAGTGFTGAVLTGVWPGVVTPLPLAFASLRCRG